MIRIAIVGPGRMGTALALASQAAGQPVVAALGRKGSPQANRFAQLTGVEVTDVSHASSVLQPADLVLLTVPDEAVTLVAQTLAESDQLYTGQIVAHTAGALSSDALHPVLRAGALPLSLHPLQTVADPSIGATRLRGACCTLEGGEQACLRAAAWVRAWGGDPVTLDAHLRPRYHAAAVLASNAVVALAAMAVEIAPLPHALQALLPLLRGAVANLERLGLPDALTGPVERADISTVKLHIQALQDNPTALQVYVALGQATVQVAVQKGSLTSDQQAQLLQLFDASGGRAEGRETGSEGQADC